MTAQPSHAKAQLPQVTHPAQEPGNPGMELDLDWVVRSTMRDCSASAQLA